MADNKSNSKKTIKGVTEHIKTNKAIKKIKGVTDHIKTNEVQKITSGADFAKKQAARSAAKEAAKKTAKKGLKSVSSSFARRGLKSLPFLGAAIGISEAISSGDAMAAVPEEFKSTDAGPKKGSLQDKLEQGTITKEERAQLGAKFDKKRKKSAAKSISRSIE